MTNDPLTPAQRRVYDLWALGLQPRAIAQHLGITTTVAANRLQRAHHKLIQHARRHAT